MLLCSRIARRWVCDTFLKMLPSFLQTLSDSRAGEPRAESSFARLPRTHCPAGTLPVTPGPLRSSHRLRRAAALPLPRPPTCKQPDAPKRRRAVSAGAIL